jgi:hypothetical protein
MAPLEASIALLTETQTVNGLKTLKEMYGTLTESWGHAEKRLRSGLLHTLATVHGWGEYRVCLLDAELFWDDDEVQNVEAMNAAGLFATAVAL